mgnify:CR=1 FL=1
MPSLPPTKTDQLSSLSSTDSLSTNNKPSLGAIQGRPLPNSLEAEQGLLAACIHDSSGEVIGRCIEQAIASLAHGIYSIKSELFIHALIKPLEKEHGTTNKWLI